uniref:Uncharacterized protein n=1 Tax=Sarcophilus harrisii TaxID=9305 RepID=A0A7N4P2Y8_SARHA
AAASGPGCQSCNPGSDMMDYLLDTGHIKHRDGLLVTWYHGANNRSEMEKALSSESRSPWRAEGVGWGGVLPSVNPRTELRGSWERL